ncbi:MAG: hypothetical protein ACK5B9_05665 [Flavobacteriia bacterium]|jgi:hypothetical protein
MTAENFKLQFLLFTIVLLACETKIDGISKTNKSEIKEINQNNCNCPKNEFSLTKSDTIFLLSNNKKIALCGYRNPDSNSVNYSEFVLSVCGEDKIIDYWDATQTCFLRINSDTLIVENLIHLPSGKGRIYETVTWAYDKIFFIQNKVVKLFSANDNIRKYNKNEIQSTLKEFENADGKLDDSKIELANRLFMCVISGNQIAKKYFKEFKTKFVLDGAFAEEYKELEAMIQLWKN